MTAFGSPAPQWTESWYSAVPLLPNILLVLDGDGYYRFYPSGVPSAVIADDGAGTLRIVASSPTPKRIAQNVTSGRLYFY